MENLKETTVNFMSINLNKIAKNGEQYHIKIRLSDPCKNGHNDFAITGTIWEAGKSKTECNSITSGAIGDHISVAFPELSIFNTLHLCDYKGAPMYADGNGHYHLKGCAEPMIKDKFCEYYRVTPKQYDILIGCADKNHYKILLYKLGIVDQWEKQANEAILLLEQMTGNKFVDNSTKSNLTPLTDEEIQDYEIKIASGYYLPESIENRRIEAVKIEKNKILEELTKEREKKINLANDEFNAKIAILDAGISLKNFIFYTHTNTAQFNWKSYEPKVSEADFSRLMKSIKSKDLGRVTWLLEYKK